MRGEGADLLVPEKPRDFGDWQVCFLQVNLGEAEFQFFQNLGKGQPFRRKPPRECARTHVELAGDFRQARLSMRQEHRNGIFQIDPKLAACALAIGAGRFSVY